MILIRMKSIIQILIIYKNNEVNWLINIFATIIRVIITGLMYHG